MGDDRGPALSVVVPVWNGATTLAAQLDALRAQRWDRAWEVVVVDNGSTDATPAIAAAAAAADGRFRVVAAPDRHNLSYVRNVGVEHTRAPAVAFADADDVVGDGWLAAIGLALDTHPLVGSRLEYTRLNPAGDHGRAEFQSTGISHFLGLPNLAGAGLGCRRELWDRLGGNDERWHDTGEDFDFSFRAYLSAGVTPVFVPDAVYHYRRRNDRGGAFRQARRYGRSHARLYAAYGRGRRGMRPPVGQAVRADLWLLLHAHRALAGDDERVAWAWQAGKRLGRLEGSLRYRALYL